MAEPLIVLACVQATEIPDLFHNPSFGKVSG